MSLHLIPIFVACGSVSYEALLRMGVHSHNALVSEIGTAALAMTFPAVKRWLRHAHVGVLPEPRSTSTTYAGPGVRTPVHAADYVYKQFTACGGLVLTEKLIKRSIMLVAHSRNPYSFTIVRNGDDVRAVGETWRIRPEAMEAMRKGRRTEADLRKEDFVAPTEPADVYVALAGESNVLRPLLRGMLWTIENGHLNAQGQVRAYALGVCDEGNKLLERLGFEPDDEAVAKKRRHRWWTIEMTKQRIDQLRRDFGLGGEGQMVTEMPQHQTDERSEPWMTRGKNHKKRIINIEA